MKRSIAVIAACIISLAGVSGFAASKKDGPAPAPQTPTAAQASQEASTLSGKVVETMNSGGYTYAQIEKSGKKTWVAIPQTEVKVGQELTFQPGAEMRNFPSPSLKRTFDSIIFSGGIMPKGGAAAAPPVSQVSSQGMHGSSVKTTEKISVEKAKGPDAYTISEIFEKKAKLNDKTAVVKAKVVKVSASIMGKNWIHLQDGTGDFAKGNNRLIATSEDLPAVGDIVTIKGTIHKDRDFGSGYKYDVIMEKASIQH